VARLLLRHGTAIDLARVRALVRQFSEILETPERPGEFDALVARAFERSKPE
jgi:hypothetical protein